MTDPSALANAWTAEQYDQFVRDSYEYLNGVQDAAKRDFALGSYERYDWSQDAGVLVFSNQGISKVIAHVQFVGSISNRTKTWLWSWDNPTVGLAVKEQIAEVRKFGEVHGLSELTTAKWEATEADGWAMTAVAARILQAKGAYRSPHDDRYIFLILTHIAWADAE